MIPKNLTVAECGALLVVVGQRMLDHDVAADVVLMLDTYTDPDDEREKLVDEMVRADWTGLLHHKRAQELLQLTLEEAITFNPADV